MRRVEVLRGCPGAGKSFYCQELMSKEPERWKRINNDAIRLGIDFGHYSPSNEKVVRALREHMIKDFLKRGFDLIIDNINAGKNFDQICEIIEKLNIDCEVREVPFYTDLEVAIERDAARVGLARVGEKIVKKWWGDLGGKSFAKYEGRAKSFAAKQVSKIWQPIEQNSDLPRAIVVDNDGTICLPHPGRNVYDASTADLDIPHAHVIECVQNYFELGYKVLFVSGREEKDRAPTERFYQKHLPEVKYELFMRPTSNKEKDVLIKERIFEEQIKGKYKVCAWIDDRLQVCRWVYENGLPLFRAGSPDADF